MFDEFSNHSGHAPAGPIDDRVRLDAARMGQPSAPFHWKQTPIVDAQGIYNYAFDTLGLVEQYPIGAGKECLVMPKVFQTPLFAFAGVVDVGLGGLVAGDILSQPLFDPQTGTYGGYPI